MQRDEVGHDRKQPAPGTCSHWLRSKSRHCGWPAVSGDLCGHHCTANRVPCPIDLTHTVAVSQLAVHVKVCTRARETASIESAPYVCKACNCGSDDEGDTVSDVATLWRLLPDDTAFEAALVEVRAVVELVRTAAATLPHDPPPAAIPDCVRVAVGRLEQQAKEAHTTEPYDERHLVQQAALVGALHSSGLLQQASRTVFAELGAGRGYLLHLLAHTCGPPGVNLLFVERRAYRFKAERSLRRTDGINAVRARCDIADFDLASAIMALFTNGTPPNRVVMVAKHLCGSATDMALRCALRCSQRDGICLVGACLAPCCHHSCTWSTYVGKPYLRRFGVGKREFGIMCRLASWCVDAHGGSRPNGSDTLSRWGYSPQERAAIGTSVKRLLDEGRAQWLAAKLPSGNASVRIYVDDRVTPENRAVVWTPATSAS